MIDFPLPPEISCSSAARTCRSRIRAPGLAYGRIGRSRQADVVFWGITDGDIGTLGWMPGLDTLARFGTELEA